MSVKVIVNRAIAPLYVEPSEKTELADEALYGAVVELCERGEGWCEVVTAYRYRGFSREECFLQDEARVVAWEAAPKHTVLRPTLDVQATPKVQAHTLITLTRGAHVILCGEPDKGWQQVELADGQLGHVRASGLAPAPLPWRQRKEQELREALVSTAKTYMGTQYRWGGKTPLGIDCSGLCSQSYLLHGIHIYRDADIRDGFAMREIPLDQAKPGDLVFFPGHVAMLMGDDLFIHSTGAAGSDGVVIDSFREGAPNYRADLKASITKVGTIFS